MSGEFPYQSYLAHPAWKALSSAIGDLEANNDVSLRTAQKYVIGHLIKTLDDAGLLPPTLPVKLTPAQLKHISWAWMFNTPPKQDKTKRGTLKTRMPAKAAG